MEKQVKVYDYSWYDTWTITEQGDNWSSIVTKMVQLAGRYCEGFASDIIYDANAFSRAVENGNDYDKYLFFRENGVTSLSYEDLAAIDFTGYIQSWHLTYNAETGEQKFIRVDVRIGGLYGN
jgi:hypothetical protein